MKRALLSFSVAFLCSLLLFTQAVAITFNLDYLFSGDLNLPPGQNPWLSASFEDLGDNSSIATYNAVELKLVASGLTSQNEYVSSWYFNYNGTKGLSYEYVSGINDNPQTDLINGYEVDSTDGIFSIFFDFSESQFGNNATSTYIIRGVGISALSFFDTNTPGDFFTAAEIIKENGGGVNSAWVAATNQPTEPVPEPATMLLLGIGLTGLAFFGRKNFLK